MNSNDQQPTELSGSARTSNADSPQGRVILLGLLLIVICFLVYLPVWDAGFFWDDFGLVAGSPIIRRANGLYLYWFTTTAPDFFPLTSTTWWLEWRLWGMNPLGYHLTNVGLHAFSTVALWRILIRLKIPGAWLAAALFAAHPVCVESVGWISERKNTLSMPFFLFSLLGYLKFEDTSKRRWYAFAIAGFVLSLLSKSATAPLPLILLGMAWWRRGQVGRRDVLRSVPFFFVAGLFAAVTIWFQHHRAIGPEIVRADGFLSRLAGAGWAVWFYLYKALLPLNLLSVYPRWQIDPTKVMAYVPGVLFVAALAVGWRGRRAWSRGLLFGLGYFAVMLLPILGFINISFMRHSYVADHWQYFAIIGPIVLMAAGVMSGLNRLQAGMPWLKPATCGLLLLIFASLAWRQAALYTNVEKLWRHTLAGNPNSVLVHNNLGNALVEAGNNDEAITHFQAALAIEPGFADAHYNLGSLYFRSGRLTEAESHLQQALIAQPNWAKTFNNLGQLRFQTGKVDEAILLFRKAVELDPDTAIYFGNLGAALLSTGKADEAVALFRKGLDLDPSSAELLNNLGSALLQQGQTDLAGNCFRDALKIRPDYANAHYNLGNVLFQTGRMDDAIFHLRKAVAIQSDYANAHNNLGRMLFLRGQLDEATAHFEKTLAVRPNDPGAAANLCQVAWVLATCPEAAVRDGDKSLALARRLDELSGGDAPHILGILAAAQAEAGQFSEAVASVQRALRLAATQTNAVLVKIFEGQMKHYQAGNPFRDDTLAGFPSFSRRH